MYSDFASVYLLSEITSYVMAGGAGYLGWRLVRAYERRTTSANTLSELRGLVKVLEDALERMDETLGQTVESQQFTTSLLLSRGRREDST